MSVNRREPTALKPGPPSYDDLIGRIDHALRFIDDRIELNRNPLTRLAIIDSMANARYSGRVHPRALALREIVKRVTSRVLADLEDEAELRMVRAFLDLYRSGATVSSVARRLGVSREHCSRSVKKRALLLLAEAFAQLALKRNRSAIEDRPRALRAS